MHRKNLILIIFIFGMFLALASNAQAANHYIRDGVNGASPDCGATTNSWNDACDDLPTTFVRGDTYYVADGNYGSHTFSTSPSGTTLITIKKATKENSGNVSDWQDSYGDGQAEFNVATGSVWTISTGYWYFDGVTGSGKSGHGIKILNTGANSSSYGIFVGGAMANYLTLNHIEIAGVGYTQVSAARGFYTNTITNNLTIKNCYFHNPGAVWIHLGASTNPAGTSVVDNALIEHCYFEDGSSGSADYHSPGVVVKGRKANMGFVFRYNVMENYLTVGSTSYLTLGMDDRGVQSGGYEVYGNVFWESDAGQGPTRIIGNTGGDTTNDVKIYNNTFYGLQNGSGFNFDAGTGIVAYNNLWYNCVNTPSFAGVLTHDYNASNFNLGETNGQILTTNPFVNDLIGDFRLKAHTTSGLNLNAPYNIDMAGNIRTTWDRGAYEFTSGQITCITGDIDCDKDVDITDIQIAVNVFLGIENDEVKRARANVDTSNPDITIADIQKVVNLFLGISN